MKTLAELSQFDELIAHMKDIAAHVLSEDNMRLKLVIVTNCDYWHILYC